MAIIKFINRSDKKAIQPLNSIKDIVDYVKALEKTELEVDSPEISEKILQEMEAVKKLLQENPASVIDYVANPEKTKSEKHTRQLVSGINCSPETAYEEMAFTKRMYGQDRGRQYIHFVQSFHPEDKVTPELVHEIGVRLAREYERFKGFQILVATHMNEAHLHSHFVINSVNFETGKKWQQSNAQLEHLKEFSDQLCRSYGLMVLPREMKFKDWIPDGQFRSEKCQNSWKHELYLAANACLKNSVNREDFIANMNRMGYQVIWSDTRKYITFVTPDGKKCRDRKLGEKFSKENMLKTFQQNQQFQNKQVMLQRMDFLLEAIHWVSRQIDEESSGSSKAYPLSRLEGQALKERLLEYQKGRGYDWDYQR